jgi:hypothetical protein
VATTLSPSTGTSGAHETTPTTRRRQPDTGVRAHRLVQPGHAAAAQANDLGLVLAHGPFGLGDDGLDGSVLVLLAAVGQAAAIACHAYSARLFEYPLTPGVRRAAAALRQRPRPALSPILHTRKRHAPRRDVAPRPVETVAEHELYLG